MVECVRNRFCLSRMHFFGRVGSKHNLLGSSAVEHLFFGRTRSKHILLGSSASLGRAGETYFAWVERGRALIFRSSTVKTNLDWVEHGRALFFGQARSKHT